MTKPLTRVLLLVVLLVLGISGHSYLRGHSALYNFFFSPADLYRNLAEADFDLSAEGMERQFQLSHQYPGNHWLAILVEKPVKFGDHYDNDFVVSVSIEQQGKVLFEQKTSDSRFWFWGRPERRGFAMLRYKVSRDLPITVPLLVNIKVTKASAGFTEKFGKQRLIISKYSDE